MPFCRCSPPYTFLAALQEHYTAASAMQAEDRGGGGCYVALPVKALKAGQESYWLDQIAKNREEYFSGKGESPGRFVGGVAAAGGLVGEAVPEQVHAMFRGLDPATGAQRCKPLLRADPRSKLAAAPLLATCGRCRRPASSAAPSGSRSRRSSGSAARCSAPTRASCTAMFLNDTATT